MSASALMDDATLRPDLFRWNGRMDPASLQAWLAGNDWLGPCPSDLVVFWQETGGGDVFETETILGPLSDPQMGDDVTSVNRAMRSRGVPARFLVFHTGLLVSAVDTDEGDCRLPRSPTAPSSRHLTVPEATASRYGRCGGRS